MREKLAYGIIFILFSGGAWAFGGDLPESIQKALNQIKSEHKHVTWLAHHFSSDHEVDFNGSRKLEGGNSLSFTFRFKNPVTLKHRTTMEFIVNDQGKLISVAVKDTSILREPFGSDLTNNDVVERRRWLQKHPEVEKSAKLLAEVENASPQELCLMYLNLQLGKLEKK